jgi:hypothetical protein
MPSWWNEGVSVVVRPGRTINVKSPMKAAELLLDVRWLPIPISRNSAGR